MAEGRERRRRGDGGQLRGEILQAVSRLLDKWGSIERLTMRAVAAEAGVSAPSIYLHFNDKTDLVWAALSEKYDQLASRMYVADQKATEEPLARLRAQMHAYCRYGLEYPGYYRLLYETRQPQVDSSRVRHHPAKVVSGSLRTAVERCNQAGYLLSQPVDQVVQTLWSGMHGSLSLAHSLFYEESLEPIVLGTADGLLDSMVAPQEPGFLDRAGQGESQASLRIRTLLEGS